jgi:hypothetical protein
MAKLGPRVCCSRLFTRVVRRTIAPSDNLLVSEAVAYQFAKVGSDEKAGELLKKLDNDIFLGEYIACLGRSSANDSHR